MTGHPISPGGVGPAFGRHGCAIPPACPADAGRRSRAVVTPAAPAAAVLVTQVAVYSYPFFPDSLAVATAVARSGGLAGGSGSGSLDGSR